MALGLSGVLKRCLRRDAPGRQLVKKVVPDAADYVVLKLKHSAFYATPLETLLSYMKAKAVILVGLTTDACIVSALARSMYETWSCSFPLIASAHFGNVTIKTHLNL